MAFKTSKSLLARVRAGDEVSWGEFYATYKPLILLCGGDCGLTEDEKEELVQQVMVEIFQKNIVGKYDPDHVPDGVLFQYDPQKGRFHYFLRKVIRNHAIKIYHKRKAQVSLNDDDHPVVLPTTDEWESIWECEWQKHVMTMALVELKNRVQPETYLAFEMYAIQDREVKEVAAFLNLSISSIYTAKSRCIAALKEIIATLEEK